MFIFVYKVCKKKRLTIYSSMPTNSSCPTCPDVEIWLRAAACLIIYLFKPHIYQNLLFFCVVKLLQLTSSQNKVNCYKYHFLFSQMPRVRQKTSECSWIQLIRNSIIQSKNMKHPLTIIIRSSHS